MKPSPYFRTWRRVCVQCGEAFEHESTRPHDLCSAECRQLRHRQWRDRAEDRILAALEAA